MVDDGYSMLKKSKYKTRKYQLTRLQSQSKSDQQKIYVYILIKQISNVSFNQKIPSLKIK